MYQPRLIPRSEFVPIRRLRYHVCHWGQPRPQQPLLVLLHGWMDVAASWQFVVDAFAQDRHVVAPDWRGFGRTEGPPADCYWFPDYLGDLDALLDHYAGDQPVDLAGHSMGGNIAMLYAGVRPGRVRRLVNLEGFGMAPTQADQAPARYARWLDEIKALYRGELDLKPYDDVGGVAARLMKTNRRLPQDKAEWLARHWARQAGDGRWHILGDPAHKIVNANLYQVEEILAAWRCITAPVLSLEASDDSLERWNKGRYTLADYHARLHNVSDARSVRIEDAGHMLHHDQPQAVAAAIERFLDG